MGTRDCPRRSRHVHTEGVRGVETPQGGGAAFAVGSFGIRSEGEAAAEDRPHPCGVGGKDVHSRGRWSRHEPGGTGRSTGMEGVPAWLVDALSTAGGVLPRRSRSRQVVEQGVESGWGALLFFFVVLKLIGLVVLCYLII